MKGLKIKYYRQNYIDTLMNLVGENINEDNDDIVRVYDGIYDDKERNMEEVVWRLSKWLEKELDKDIFDGVLKPTSYFNMYKIKSKFNEPNKP